jgi:hypothetical protein
MTHGTMLGIEATRSGTRPTPNYPGPDYDLTTGIQSTIEYFRHSSDVGLRLDT